jgi:hypothetical protein
MYGLANIAISSDNIDEYDTIWLLQSRELTSLSKPS